MDKELTQTPEQKRDWIKKSLEQLAQSLKDDPEMIQHALDQFAAVKTSQSSVESQQPIIQPEPDVNVIPKQQDRPDDNGMSKYQEVVLPLLKSSKEIELTAGQEVTIGRREAESDEQNWITLNQRSVSRTHAKIGRDDQGYYIQDLGNSGEGSTYGTIVSGNKIAPGEKVRLEGNQIIKIGQVDVDLSINPSTSKMKLSWGSQETPSQT